MTLPEVCKGFAAEHGAMGMLSINLEKHVEKAVVVQVVEPAHLEAAAAIAMASGTRPQLILAQYAAR